MLLHVERNRLPGRRAHCYTMGGNSTNGKVTRCLPSFTISGVGKSGTSALHYYLARHPSIVMQRKEICPVARDHFETTDIYFESLPTWESLCADCIVGDSCIVVTNPIFTWATSIVHRSLLPTISLSFLLVRNPLDHEYASYFFWCTDEEVESFKSAAAGSKCDWRPREPVTLLIQGVNVTLDFERSPEDFHRRKVELARAGKRGRRRRDYKTLLPILHEAYGKENVMVIVSERLRDNTEAVLVEVQKRLEIPFHDFGNLTESLVNTNGNPGIESLTSKRKGPSYPPMLELTRTMFRYEVEQDCRAIEILASTEVCRYWGVASNDR